MDQISSEEAKAFLGRLALECSQNGVTLKLLAEEAVENDGVPCAGWFDDELRELVVATGVPLEEWYLTALHEYCHMLQWIEDPVTFIELETSEDNIFKWLRGDVEYTEAEVSKFATDSTILEGDCERRVLEMIAREKLSVNPDMYGRKGSAYAHFYKMVARKRKWYTSGFAPYALDDVWPLFPAEVDPLWTPTEQHFEAYEKCFSPEVPELEEASEA